jgi:hypothetical protein
LTSFNYLVAQFPRQYLCETAEYRLRENARHNKQDVRQAGIDNWRAIARICRFARVHPDWNHFQPGTLMPARILGEPASHMRAYAVSVLSSRGSAA